MFADTATAAIVFAALYAGHHVGDYLIQSDHQALNKGRCDHEGRKACTAHVLTLTIAQGAVLALVLGATGTAIDPAALLTGLGINAVSHFWADRRSTLRGLVLATERWTHKIGFYDGGGAAHMDQAWHMLWLVPAAVAIAAPLPLAGLLTAFSAALLVAADIASRRARATEAASQGAGA
ncbi:DUF3307 domain-containing protein [Nocardiopsis halophila]|uniref:DUF3307 domain-containing protein n=1 Tax=Nocardiopsis halophila TaxID=141692 RepID=UPI00034C0E97|nr:DUF3307 domain-containing protein [Nocardiopsis halophila]